MAKKKIVITQNYLEKIPVRNSEIEWKTDENSIITLEIQNKGWANKIAQTLFKRPKVSFVHMEEVGSFVWPLIDGERNITQIGVFVKEHFGEKAEPLYERLARYFQIMESYHFITFKK